MNSTEMLSSLSLFTLAVPLLIAALALAFFLRRRSNREPLEGKQERNIAKDLDAGRSAPDNLPPE